MYQPVLVYNEKGDYLGKAIMKDGSDRLQSINIYKDSELEQLTEALERLNVSKELYDHWPDARDIDVQTLLAKEDFCPIELAEQEMIDDDNSFLVYERDSQDRQTENIDYSKSVIVKKTAIAPVRPSDVVERTKKAQETVARERMAAGG